MQYFKHSELSERYHVSLKTVHNWIDAAKQGKITLRLFKAKTRTYIADTPENNIVLQQLSEKGKKYRNTLHHKIIHPTAKFYEIYNRRQILDIITNLDVHGEIPRQYNYFEDGAHNWDKLITRHENSNSNSLIKGTRTLLRVNLDAVDRLLEPYTRINIIDLGVGNAKPSKDLIAHLLQKGLINRYIAIDISKEMLNIAENNLKKWFGNQLSIETYARDLAYERFDDLLVDDMLDQQSDQTLNLVLLLGATPKNFRSFTEIFNVIYGSIGTKDLLMYTDKRDTLASRMYFDFKPDPSKQGLSPNHKYILDLLGMDEKLYITEMGYDEKKRMRYIRIRLKTALTIRFDFGNAIKDISFEKDSTIQLLHIWHLSVLDVVSVFEKTGFTLLQSTMTPDREYFLSICGVETKLTAES